MQKTILSGVKPTGRPHIGNYFGAMRQFVELQNEYQSYFMIADYHALNLIQNAKEMRELSLDVAIEFLNNQMCQSIPSLPGFLIPSPLSLI